MSRSDHWRSALVFQVMDAPAGPTNSQYPCHGSAICGNRRAGSAHFDPGLLHLSLKRAIPEQAKTKRVGQQTPGDGKPGAVHLKNGANLGLSPIRPDSVVVVVNRTLFLGERCNSPGGVRQFRV